MRTKKANTSLLGDLQPPHADSLMDYLYVPNLESAKAWQGKTTESLDKIEDKSGKTWVKAQ